MPDDHRDRTAEIFLEACDLPPDERKRFLDEACADEPALRAEVESLLAHDDVASRAMGEAADAATGEEPTLVAPFRSSDDQATLVPGQVVAGEYRIRSLLGRGGMGAVYEAVQVESRRTVAIKVISGKSSAATVERFLREGRLAASVNHPNSVYVFEAIAVGERLLIVMELVRGGNLDDAVRRKGPMPPAQSVDAILDVIAGLEAAHEVGVLHRDVKPSNCFVDPDGNVKVGDYGLSVSSDRDERTKLTATGTMLGTPAFSAPEQLRGGEADIRSDIYSVGATLYFILTGRPPIERDNPVELISAILEQRPQAPHLLRREIPRGLSKAVLRCLAKRPDQRYASYAELRRALLPFNSAAPEAADLARRFAAGVLDHLASQVPGKLLFVFLPWVLIGDLGAMVVHSERSSVVLLSIAEAGLLLLYYIPEGIWGCSLGKVALGLRVTNVGGEPATVYRALARAALFLLAVRAPFFVFSVLWHTAPEDLDSSAVFLLVAAPAPVLLGCRLALFVSVKRSNGFAGIHELLSGTRTIGLRTDAPARATEFRPVPTRRPVASGQRVGPYQIVETLRSDGDRKLLLGYDDRLRRLVWVLVGQPGDASIPPARCDLARPGRLRWLGGGRTANESWDAFDAPAGQPLLALPRQGARWALVRTWLDDLAGELEACETSGDETLVLDLDRVWITSDWRARILDFPAPGISLPTQTDCEANPMSFLARVAAVALGDSRATTTAPRVPLPLRARSCLTDLARRAFTDTRAAVKELRHVSPGEATVSRWKRVVPFMLLAIPPALLSAIAFGVVLSDVETSREYPELGELRVCLDRLAEFETDNPDGAESAEKRNLETYIAGRFRHFNDSESASLYIELNFEEGRSALFNRVVGRPPPDADALHAAEAALRPLLAGASDEAYGDHGSALSSSLLMAVVVAGVIGLLSTLTTAFLRGGITMRLLGIAVVRGDGAEASRLHVLGRVILAWSPILVCLVAAILAMEAVPDRGGSVPSTIGWICAPAIVVMVLGAIWSVIVPERGPHDRVALTFLVPR